MPTLGDLARAVGAPATVGDVASNFGDLASSLWQAFNRAGAAVGPQQTPQQILSRSPEDWMQHPAVQMAMGLAPFGHVVYHGSPHMFDAFDISKVGTGEGAQAYGHGMYFAENPKVAQSYSGSLSDGVYSSRVMPAGSLYKADIPDELIPKMLDWDKPLSQQPQAVRQAFADAMSGGDETASSLLGSLSSPQEIMNAGLFPHSSGAQAYNTFAAKNPQQASSLLNQAGIPGIRYLDAGSRGAGEGTYNYVLFDPSVAKILSRE